jgi:hypothetical protein
MCWRGAALLRARPRVPSGYVGSETKMPSRQPVGVHVRGTQPGKVLLDRCRYEVSLGCGAPKTYIRVPSLSSHVPRYWPIEPSRVDVRALHGGSAVFLSTDPGSSGVSPGCCSSAMRSSTGAINSRNALPLRLTPCRVAVAHVPQRSTAVGGPERAATARRRGISGSSQMSVGS